MDKAKIIFAEQLIKISEMDLKAAQSLYEKQFYPQAVFLFQQSVEKLDKAFALISNKIKLEDLRRISHSHFKIHEEILSEQQERFKNFLEYSKSYESLDKLKTLNKFDINRSISVIQEFLNLLDAYKNDPIKLIRLSADQIRICLDELKKIYADHQKIREAKIKINISETELKDSKFNLIDAFSSFYKHDPSIKVELINKLDALDVNMMKQIYELFIRSMEILYFPYVSLVVLSILTKYHAVNSRYPDERTDPVELYRKDLPFIELLPEIFEYQEKTIAGIIEYKKFFENFKFSSKNA